MWYKEFMRKMSKGPHEYTKLIKKQINLCYTRRFIQITKNDNRFHNLEPGQWDLLLAIVGVKWVFPLTVRETLPSWGGSFVGKKHKKAWVAAPLSIFWSIWCKRNYIAFESKDFSAQSMKASFICNLWSWSNVHIVERPRSLVDYLTWLDSR